MELAWLEDFIALCETNNFSRAADARNVTQPAFSRRIMALEEWVGTALVDRTAYRIRITEAGKCFQTVGLEIIQQLHSGREQALEAGTKEQAALHFAATHALSFAFFPKWLRSLNAHESGGPVHLVSDTMKSCEEAMIRGDVHFLLAHSHDHVPNRLDALKYSSKIIGHDILVPVSAPGLLSDGQRIDLDDRSRRVPYLAYSADSGLGRIISAVHAANQHPANLDVIFTSHQAAVLRQVALSGEGMTWIPQSLIEEDLAARRLVPAGSEPWRIEVDIRLFRPKARQVRSAEAFWQSLQ